MFLLPLTVNMYVIDLSRNVLSRYVEQEAINKLQIL